MIGEASQKAITAESGTPIANRAAISGITPQEQKGEMPPASAPSPIINRGVPVKALAIRLSAPVAPAHAAIAIDNTRKGAVLSSALNLTKNALWADLSSGQIQKVSQVTLPRVSHTRLCLPKMAQSAIQKLRSAHE